VVYGRHGDLPSLRTEASKPSRSSTGIVASSSDERVCGEPGKLYVAPGPPGREGIWATVNAFGHMAPSVVAAALSENVSHELGAASVMYDDRIILFKEGVQLASNYSGIGYITFEKDALDAKVNDLLRELVAFKSLKLSIGDDE
jgi:hypothetical protein